MAEKFEYFPLLPTELRLMIWEFCLPCRTAEYDEPWYQLDGKRGHQHCSPYDTFVRNSRLPTIAFVNQESRHVALQNGRVVEKTYHDLVDPFAVVNELKWIQPRRDKLHLNWNREIASWDEGSLSVVSELPTFLAPMISWGMRASITADTIHTFGLRGIYDGYVTPENGSQYPDPPYGLYSFSCEEDVAQIAHFAYGIDTFREPGVQYSSDSFPNVMDVAMVTMSLHVSREAALSSGLFGLLGDAPVQMVDVHDANRLAEFEALSRIRTCHETNEPKLESLFTLIKTSNFQNAVDAWIKKAQMLIAIAIWKQAREDGDVAGEVPTKAPDENNQWTRTIANFIPRLRPQIMLRHCVKQCHIKEGVLGGY